MAEKQSQYSAPTVTIPEIQRAIQQVYDDLNHLYDSVNIETGTASEEHEGKPGDIRLVKESDSNHALEIRTEEGWKRGSIGGNEVIYSGIKSRKQVPKADTGFLPSPDYDSGWHTAANNQVWITGATTGAVPDNLKTFTLHTNQLSDGEIKELPELGFKMLKAPSIQINISSPGVQTFDDAMSCGIFTCDNASEVIYSAGWQRRGIYHFLPSDNQILLSTGGHGAFFGYNGAYAFDTAATDFYKAFDSEASAYTFSFNVQVWK